MENQSIAQSIAMKRRSFLLGASGALGLAFTKTAWAQTSGGAGGTLRVAITKPAGDLNPHKFAGLWAAQDLMFEPLMNYGPGGEILPCLASAWSVEDGGKTLKLTLREDVVFQDGTPFDAAAVKWNFERWIGLDSTSWMNSSRLFKSLDIVDNHHVTLHFNEPPLGLLQELTYIRPVRFLSPKSVAADGAYVAPVGTGPWKQTNASESGSVFERFDAYWGEKPGFATLELKVLPDSRNRMAALRAGDIDLIGGAYVSPLTATEAQTLKSAGVDVAIKPGTTTLILGFNPDHVAALKDPMVRKAINVGIDRAAISQVLYRGYAEVAANLFATGVPMSGTRYDVPAIDPQGARDLLEKAGWTGDGIRTKDGVPLAMEIIVSEEQIPGSRSVAEVLQSEFRDIGIDLSIRSVDHASRHSDIPARKYDLAFFLTYDAPYDPFGSVVGMFLSTYDNGVDGKLFMDAGNLDPLVTAAMSASEAEMQSSLQTVYDWLHDNAAIAPLLYVPSIWAHSTRVTGFQGPATEYDLPYEHITLAE